MSPVRRSSGNGRKRHSPRRRWARGSAVCFIQSSSLRGAWTWLGRIRRRRRRCAARSGPFAGRTAPPPGACRRRGGRRGDRGVALAGGDDVLAGAGVDVAEGADGEPELRVAGRPEVGAEVADVEVAVRPDRPDRITLVPRRTFACRSRSRKTASRAWNALPVIAARKLRPVISGAGSSPAASRNVGARSVRLTNASTVGRPLAAGGPADGQRHVRAEYSYTFALGAGRACRCRW